MKFTEEQKELARRLVRDNERRTEMMYDDMQGELAMRLGLDDDEVFELIEQVER